MPKVVVEIELDTETGAVRVGMDPQEGAAPAKDLAAGAGLQPDQGQEDAQAPQLGSQPQEGGEADYLQPVKDVATALQVAGDMLQGKTGSQAQAANAEGDFTNGFSKGAGAPAGRPTRPMPQAA